LRSAQPGCTLTKHSSPSRDFPTKHAYMTPEREDDEPGINMASPDSGDADSLSPLFDERLRLVDIAQWTPVPIPNELAISTISHYLENDYATIPLFNADLFVQDLVNLQQSFCSSFLVTAILCWACQASTPLHPDAAAYSVALFAQAQQHFSEQPHQNSLTTIAALQILSMCAVTYGKDDMSLRFLQESVRLGRLMGLFDVASQTESAEMWLGNHEDWAKTASYTAWGVYNWVSVYSLHYHIFEIETPPLLPKPRGLLSHSEDSASALHAQVLSASSDMWVVFNDVVQKFYGPASNDASPQTSLKFAEQTYHRLLHWASGLPIQLARAEESGHNVMMMHIYFHAVVTDLFRPFLDSPLRTERLLSFATKFATPEAAYAASVTQLKRLLLLYRLRYKSASLSMLWQTVVVYVANAMIREAGTAVRAPDMPPSDDWRFYLDLCLAGLEDLYVSFPVFGSIAQGMVGMALRQAAIRTGKAARVLRQLGEIEKQHAASQGMTDKVEARWIIDFDLAMTDPEAAQGRNLVEQLEGLMLNEMRLDDPG
ncbi:C6 transcription factor, partial [Colletotrichum tofieldiae]